LIEEGGYLSAIIFFHLKSIFMQQIEVSKVPIFFDGTEIPTWVALSLIQTYRTMEGWGSTKTRAAWFSVDDLNKIIALVNTQRGDGVRVYLGKYPYDVDLPDTPNEIYKTQSRETLVFVPTIASPVGGHMNIVDVDDLTEEGKSIVVKSTDPKLFFNHGELEP
jgi:hypothetical protein